MKNKVYWWFSIRDQGNYDHELSFSFLFKSFNHFLFFSVEWTVKRRFREFAELHETLLEAGVEKDSLPEKK